MSTPLIESSNKSSFGPWSVEMVSLQDQFDIIDLLSEEEERENTVSWDQICFFFSIFE